MGGGNLTQMPEHWPFDGETGREMTGVEVEEEREKMMKRVTEGVKDVRMMLDDVWEFGWDGRREMLIIIIINSRREVA